MFPIAIRVAAAASLLIAASLGVSAQQPAPTTPSRDQMPAERGHSAGQGQGMNQVQGQGQGSGMGTGGMGQGQGGMMNDMHKMHQGSGTPPSSAHAPAPQGAPTPATPQCPAGTTVQIDDKGQHTCK